MPQIKEGLEMPCPGYRVLMNQSIKCDFDHRAGAPWSRNLQLIQIIVKITTGSELAPPYTFLTGAHSASSVSA